MALQHGSVLALQQSTKDAAQANITRTLVYYTPSQHSPLAQVCLHANMRCRNCDTRIAFATHANV